MRSSAALLVGVLLVVSVVAGVGTGYPGDDPASTALPDSRTDLSDASGALPDAPTAGSAPPSAVDASSVDASAVGSSAAVNASANATTRDATEMYVAIDENGNARWNVTARFVLRDGNETAAFRQLAQDYENGVADVGVTREPFARVLDRAATDRPMALEDVSRTGGLRENDTVGVLSLSFTWTNFTVVEDNRIVLGDAFWLGSETWLPSLADDQSLTVEGPPGYYVDRSGVPINNGTRIHFEGPRTFERGDFAITYAPKQTVTTTADTTTTTTGDFPLSGSSGLLVVLVVFGIGFGAYAVSQRRDPDPDVAASESVDAGQSPPAPEVDAAETPPADEGDRADDDGPPPELLSDEERVLRLLRNNDGRMKQAQIVKETNWSNAKVSQLLSKMNDDGDVNKLRIGRENLITLPDEDVTDFD